MARYGCSTFNEHHENLILVVCVVQKKSPTWSFNDMANSINIDFHVIAHY